MEPGALLDLDLVIRDAWEMPPLPASVGRLAGLVTDPTSDLGDIVEVVEFDQALTAKLLRAANSAASASARQITTVAEAVQRLGGGMVLSFATAHGTREQLHQPLVGYELEEGVLWRHSVASALVAQVAPGVLKMPVPSVSFTVALLHDIGKLLLNRFLDGETRQLLRRAQEEGGIAAVAAESEILGINHAELGGMMAQHWDLPALIIRGIHYHHTPDEFAEAAGLHKPEEQKVCDVAHLADAIAHWVERGAPSDEPLPVQRGCWERLKLDDGKIEQLGVGVREQFDTVLSRYE